MAKSVDVWFEDWAPHPAECCAYCGDPHTVALSSKSKSVCENCINGTHAYPPRPGRRCENPSCGRPLPPRWVAVYCSVSCALDDAD